MLSYVFGKSKSKNKRGWLRVVEACMAIIILIGFVMIIMNKAEVKETNMQEKVNGFILEIEKDEEIREMMFREIPYGYGIENRINEIIPDEYEFNFEFEGYNPDSIKSDSRERFASSIIIASVDDDKKLIYKKFILYLWE